MGILLRLYKYERLAESKAGLITPDNEAVYTAGGRPDLRLNEAEYQTRGIIVALSNEAKEQTDYKEGDIVWIAEKVIDKNRAFMTTRVERVSLDEGFFTAFPGEIQAIEI
jgi:co-chaperonin GroES (HSP10)